MHARSALFDLYGDHLLARGGRAPVAGLVRLLAPLGVAAPAVRTAVSRMVRQGWLTPVALPAGPGYVITDRARERLARTAVRIYRGEQEPWDGSWDVLALGPFPGRSSRDRVRRALGFLGYAQLADGTWIAPRPSPEVRGVLTDEGVACVQLSASVAAPDLDVVRGLWDVDALAREYDAWQAEATALLATLPDSPTDEEAFAVRSRLLHSWRKFLFADPGLPAALLPEPWPGEAARQLFEEHATRLLPAARRFVDDVLGPAPQEDGVPVSSSPTTPTEAS